MGLFCRGRKGTFAPLCDPSLALGTDPPNIGVLTDSSFVRAIAFLATRVQYSCGIEAPLRRGWLLSEAYQNNPRVLAQRGYAKPEYIGGTG